MITNFKKYRKEGPGSKKLLWVLGGVIFLTAAVILIFANVKIYQKKQQLLSQVENLKKEIQEQQNQNENLKEGILKSDDPDYIEKVAREELDLQKEGEKVVTFLVSGQEQQETQAENKNTWFSWLSGLWRFIKNIF